MLEQTNQYIGNFEFDSPTWPSVLSKMALDLLTKIGDGEMGVTPYDTAWAARLEEIEPEIAYQALDWLRENQLSDGSWGSSANIYHHDRVISTLAAITALARKRLPRDEPLIQCGLFSLRHHVKLLAEDGAGKTIAFEYLVPTLLREVEELGLNTTGFADVLSQFQCARQQKLNRIPGNMIDRNVTMAFSAEMAGHDNHQILNLKELTESNGSVGLSPSATAYYLLEHNPDDLAARHYLRANFKDGGLTVIAPFDVFERAWVLWNLSLVTPMTSELRSAAERHITFLKRTWSPGIGIGQSSPYTLCDGDDTAFVFELLCRYGESPDIDALLHYEEETHFRCFEHEANASISTNIHMLGALQYAGFDDNHPAITKTIKYLQAVGCDGYWFGKWHASPFYPTSHLVIAAAERFPQLISATNHWLHKTQYSSGGWGYYGATAEETAYALQALFTMKQHGYKVSEDALLAGSKWLLLEDQQTHPHLWVGKCLYAPVHVIESTVLSALSLANQHFPEINSWIALKELHSTPTG